MRQPGKWDTFNREAHAQEHARAVPRWEGHLTATGVALQVEQAEARERARRAIEARETAYQLRLRDRIQELEARNLQLAAERDAGREFQLGAALREMYTAEQLARELERRAGSGAHVRVTWEER